MKEECFEKWARLLAGVLVEEWLQAVVSCSISTDGMGVGFFYMNSLVLRHMHSWSHVLRNLFGQTNFRSLVSAFMDDKNWSISAILSRLQVKEKVISFFFRLQTLSKHHGHFQIENFSNSPRLSKPSPHLYLLHFTILTQWSKHECSVKDVHPSL